MGFQMLTRDDHFRNDGRPKRILALDGGGLRRTLSIGILDRVEDLLRDRHGKSPDFRLCHYFDLIAGTSTAAIIAAALAQGRSVAEVRENRGRTGVQRYDRVINSTDSAPPRL